MTFGSAVIPYAPFNTPVPIPASGPTDGPLYVVKLTGEWMALLAGCAYALAVGSSWRANSADELNQARQWGWEVVRQIDERNPDINLVYRPDPSYPLNFQYSIDGGTTWLQGPNTADAFVPQFVPDSASPSGYDLTVNRNHSNATIPLLTATDPNAVVENPISDLVNVVAPGVDINALKLIAQGNANALTIVNQGIALGELFLMIAAL